MPKRVTSWRSPSLCHCPRATQLFLKKCRSSGEPLATLSLIWPASDLNHRPPAPESNELPFDRLWSLLPVLGINSLIRNEVKFFINELKS